MNTQLEACLQKPYGVELVRIPEDEGGGFFACIPELGRNTFIGDGATEAEAMANLRLLQRELFTSLIENGVPIPDVVQNE